MNFIKFVRIFLLALIFIGLGMLLAQKIWVPKLVEFMLSKDTTISVISASRDTLASHTNVATTSTVSPKLLSNLKTFTESTGVYSVNYPSSWTYTEGGIAVGFYNTKDQNKAVDIVLGNDFDTTIKDLSQQASSEKIKVGSNTFTKFSLSRYKSSQLYLAYILPIGSIGGRTAYLAVSVDDTKVAIPDDLNSLLGSIKIFPSKLSIAFAKVDNIQSDAQIQATVASIRASAELYFDSGNTYAGLCDGTSEKAKVAYLDKAFTSILKIVPASNIYCNASDSAYVYSVHNLSGSIFCADSTGFAGFIKSNPKALSCK